MITADDRLAIIDAVHRWSHVADGHDPSGLREVVTEDATFVIAGGARYDGRAAVEAHLAADVAAREMQPRRHVRNTIFVETSGDRVVTRSYYLLTGVPETGLARPLGTGVYEDELVRTPAGWRVRRRLAVPDGAVTAGP